MESNKPLTYSLDAEKIFIHDLSSPLMIAAGWLERWARRDPAAAEAEEFAKVAVQLERLQTIISDRRELLLKGTAK